MSDESGQNRNIVRRAGESAVPARTLKLGQQEELDLSNLSAAEAEKLEVMHNQKAIERDNRRQTLKDDLTATAAKLGMYAKTMNETAAENASVTITNTNDDALGRTEIIVGNTDAARSGKLSRSQTGLPDGAKIWIIITVIVAAVIVLVAALSRGR